MPLSTRDLRRLSVAIALAPLAALTLQSCGGGDKPEAAKTIDLPNACKKYVSELMGRPTETMSVDYTKDDEQIVGISYTRADDGKLFKYECKTDGTSIVWRGVDIFAPGEGPGRWREEDSRQISDFI